MNLNWRSALVGFCVGLLVGGLVAKFAGQNVRPGKMSPEKKQERVLKRLSGELSLTEEQKKEVSVILAEGRRDLDKTMDGMRSGYDAVRATTNARIREKLTPEQIEKFDVLNRKMEERWKKRRAERRQK